MPLSKIGVISDTHGDNESFCLALENCLKDCNTIIHAGDILNHGPRNKIPLGYNPEKLAENINKLPIEIFFAKGNCDSEVDQMLINFPIASPFLYIIIEGIKILVAHGDKPFDFHYKNIDFYITGHTHTYNIKSENSTIFLNPGSLSLPKNHHNGTLAIIDIALNLVSIFDVKNKSVLAELHF